MRKLLQPECGKAPKRPIAVSDNFRRLLKARDTGGLQLRR